ncbi:MAG: hypothetical protein ACREDY_18325, partial [Bradyrhizobium sp.]
MPVTARLSRRFYDAFGEDVVNELVEWFNMIDAAYHDDLRQLNEANFGRFDATLERRLAELRGEMHQEIAALRDEMHAGFGAIREEIAAFRTELANQRAEMIKWMFLFWATTALGV